MKRLALLVCLLLAAPAWATDYYVNGTTGTDPATCTGNDGGCGAVGSPCKTLKCLVNERAVGPNDTVHVAAGVYRDGGVAISSQDDGDATGYATYTSDGGAVIFEGVDSAPLDDVQFVACTAANDCDGNSVSDAAYTNSYKIAVTGRTVSGVVETGTWTNIRVDDTGGSTGGAIFDLTRPIPYQNAGDYTGWAVNGQCSSPITCVDLIAGTWWVNSLGYLVVHTYQGGNPATSAYNLETTNLTSSTDNSVFLISGNYVKLDGITVRYSNNNGVEVTGDNAYIKDLTAYSGSGSGLTIRGGGEFATIENYNGDHWYNRDTWLNAPANAYCFTATCGWHQSAGGTALKLDGGSGAGKQIRGIVINGATVRNSWNGFSADNPNGALVDDLFAQNTPNHAWIIQGNGVNCTGNKFYRNYAMNDQDNFYITGCTNGEIYRSVGNIFFHEQSQNSPPYASAPGWKISGHLRNSISVCPDYNGDGISCTQGFTSNYSWNPNATSCSWGASGTLTAYACRDNSTGWRSASHCNCDATQSTGTVALTGVTFPWTNGLTLSTKTRADFVPTAGSTGTIDLGDTDVCRPAGCGQTCNSGNYCENSRQDIGPGEYSATDHCVNWTTGLDSNSGALGTCSGGSNPGTACTTTGGQCLGGGTCTGQLCWKTISKAVSGTCGGGSAVCTPCGDTTYIAHGSHQYRETINPPSINCATTCSGGSNPGATCHYGGTQCLGGGTCGGYRKFVGEGSVDYTTYAPTSGEVVVTVMEPLTAGELASRAKTAGRTNVYEFTFEGARPLGLWWPGAPMTDENARFDRNGLDLFQGWPDGTQDNTTCSVASLSDMLRNVDTKECTWSGGSGFTGTKVYFHMPGSVSGISNTIEKQVRQSAITSTTRDGIWFENIKFVGNVDMSGTRSVFKTFVSNGTAHRFAGEPDGLTLEDFKLRGIFSMEFGSGAANTILTMPTNIRGVNRFSEITGGADTMTLDRISGSATAPLTFDRLFVHNAWSNTTQDDESGYDCSTGAFTQANRGGHGFLINSSLASAWPNKQHIYVTRSIFGRNSDGLLFERCTNCIARNNLFLAKDDTSNFATRTTLLSFHLVQNLLIENNGFYGDEWPATSPVYQHAAAGPDSGAGDTWTARNNGWWAPGLSSAREVWCNAYGAGGTGTCNQNKKTLAQAKSAASCSQSGGAACEESSSREDYGGTTSQHLFANPAITVNNFALQAGHPWIDAGHATSCASTVIDGDGVGGSACDIGPLEKAAPGGGDSTAPSAVTLSVTGQTSSTCTVQWTMTYDDGNDSGSGSPTTHLIKRDASNANTNFATSAVEIAGTSGGGCLAYPVTPVGGASQCTIVTGLSASTTYHFASRVSDEVPNHSAISADVTCTTSAAADSTDPGDITDLAVSNITGTTALLTWTPTGDDGGSGQATATDIRYAADANGDCQEIDTHAEFAAIGGAGNPTNEPAPELPANGTQTYTLTGLTAGTAYCAAIELIDEAGNHSTVTGAGAREAFTTVATVACNDGADNDSDGYIDGADIGCSDTSDATETTLAGSSWTIPCTDSAFTQALHDLNVSGGKTVQFDSATCSASTVITLNATSGTAKGTCQGGSNNLEVCTVGGDCPGGNCRIRDIFSDGNTLLCPTPVGASEPKQRLTLQPDVANQWRNTSRCGNADEDCLPCDITGDGTPDRGLVNCGGVSDQTPRLMVVRGDTNTIQNCGWADWGDGPRIDSGASSAAVGTQLLSVAATRCGDTCIGTDPADTFTATGTLIDGAYFSLVNDKAVQIYGRTSGWSGAGDYDVKIKDATCVNCHGFIRATGDGYFVLENIASNEVAVPNPLFECDYALWTSNNGGYFTIDGLSAASCEKSSSPSSLTIEGDSQVVLTNASITGLSASGIGVRVDGTAMLAVSDSEFPSGIGVKVLASHGSPGVVDLGGGSITFTSPLEAFDAANPAGNNDFRGAANGVENLDAATIKAENNYWNDCTTPSNDYTGLVDAIPVHASCVDLDITAPDPVSTLAVVTQTMTSCTVSWTNKGDDGNTGTLTGGLSDVRYTTGTGIVESGATGGQVNWSAATNPTGEPAPTAPDTSQQFVIPGLVASTAYKIRMKQADEVPNYSTLSNEVTCTTNTTQPPITNPETVTGATIEGGGVQ